MAPTEATYRLYYWPVLPGRGEFVRLVLEQAGAAYDDVARRPEEEGGGIPAIVRLNRGELGGMRAFAPPVLVHDDLWIAQTANICAYLGARHELAPADEGGRAHALQLQLTITDFVAEVHDTHHPISTGKYYEEQKAEAIEYTQQFVDQRMPKYLRYFEAVLQDGGGSHLLGEALSYPDLSMAQVLRGLEHAFPRAYAHYRGELPGLVALRERVDALPRIAAYRASDRCLPFNEHGIFRAYPELDLAPRG